MADGLGGETENLLDQEKPISPIQRQSSGVQSRDSNVPSSRVGKWLACNVLLSNVHELFLIW